MPPHRPQPPRTGPAGWLARTALLLSGLTMVSTLMRGRVRIRPSRSTDGVIGRGAHAVPPSIAAKTAGHETEDMSGVVMARLLIGLGTTVALVVGLMTAYVATLSPQRNGPALTAQQTAPIAPPAPNLQATPLEDIDALRHREEVLLDNYAWIDPARTRARIPLDRAKVLVIGRPLDTAP